MTAVASHFHEDLNRAEELFSDLGGNRSNFPLPSFHIQVTSFGRSSFVLNSRGRQVESVAQL